MKIHIKIILPIIVILFLLILLVGCLPGLLTPPPPKGVISGRIMVPSSETAKDITGWVPVANATVTLTDSEGVTHTVTTNEDGYYTFTEIAVNANTIITATATVDGNTVIIKDVIPQVVAADEVYDAGAADAESTALGLIVEELLEQGLDPEDINLEEIQDSDNFTEVAEQVSTVLEENGNVTTDPGVTETVNNAAEEIISPPAYTPPEEPPEPSPEPTPEPEYTPPPVTPKELTGIVVLPVTMTLFVGEGDSITSITASYNYGSDASIALAACSYKSNNESVATVATGVVTGVADGSATITVSYTEGGITKEDTVVVTVNPIELTSIVVLPETMTLFVGDSKAITSITAHYSDGSTASIALGNCTYTSGATSIATVSNAGVVTAVAAGKTTITVTYASMTDTIEVTVNKPVHNIDTDEYYDTIQVAIDDALTLDGHTIEVAPGTYKERITIEKELVIQSTDGAENTIIDGNGVCNNVVNIWHKNVTFEGFTVTNPTAGACDDAAGIYVQDPSNLNALLVNNVHVLNNIVEATKSASEGTSSYGPAGIVIGPSSNVTVSGNIIRNLHNYPDVETDHTTGINVWGSDEASRPFDIVISGNVISDTDDYGILLEYAHNVQIENNSVTECEVGIRVDPFVGATVSDLTVNYNNLFGNTDYGVLNTMVDEIDATYNWWGSEYGPQHDGLSALGGDAVSDNVDFADWLLSEY